MALLGRRQPGEGGDASAIVAALEESLPACRAWPRPKPSELPLGRAFAERTDDEVRVAALALLEHLVARKGPHIDYYRSDLVSRMLVAVGRKKRGWTPAEALHAVALASDAPLGWQTLGIAGFVASVLEQAGGCPDPAAVQRYADRLASTNSPAQAAKALARLRPFVPAIAGDIDARIADDGDDWGVEVRRLLGEVDDPTGIDDLLGHLSASSTRPSKRWLTRTTELVGAAPEGAALLRRMAAAVLDADLRPGRNDYVPPTLFAGANADLARGVMFGVALGDPSSAVLLGDVACHTGTTSSGSGVARDEKVANGSVAALGLLGTDAAVGALVRAEQRIKNRNIRKQIARSLAAAADAAGIGLDELVERAVPGHGLGRGDLGGVPGR